MNRTEQDCRRKVKRVGHQHSCLWSVVGCCARLTGWVGGGREVLRLAKPLRIDRDVVVGTVRAASSPML